MPVDIKLYKVGSSIGYWDFIREIPLFRTVAKVRSEKWKERLKEEHAKLNYLTKLSQKNIIFDKIEQLNNQLVFNCKGHFPSGEKILFNIRLPTRYPMSIPIAEKFYIKDWYRGVEKRFRHACLGRMENRWRKDGRMGIAHFLIMLAYYTTMAEFSVNTPKEKKLKTKKLKK